MLSQDQDHDPQETPTHKSAEMALLQCSFCLVHLLILHKCVGALDLYPHQPPKLLKVAFQVPLTSILYIEVDNKQGAGGFDVAPAGVLPPLNVPVALLIEQISV